MKHQSLGFQGDLIAAPFPPLVFHAEPYHSAVTSISPAPLKAHPLGRNSVIDSGRTKHSSPPRASQRAGFQVHARKAVRDFRLNNLFPSLRPPPRSDFSSPTYIDIQYQFWSFSRGPPSPPNLVYFAAQSFYAPMSCRPTNLQPALTTPTM